MNSKYGDGIHHYLNPSIGALLVTEDLVSYATMKVGIDFFFAELTILFFTSVSFHFTPPVRSQKPI